MSDATVIPLDFWQDPQGDVILVYSEDECSIYFACWSASGIPADFIGHLSFERAAGVRSYGREYLPYRVTLQPKCHSYILQIENSELVREHVAYRHQHYPNFPGPNQKHYVVVGHDIYHEILAEGFVAETIPNQTLVDSRLRRLVTLA